MFSLPAAILLGFIFETLFYGVFLVIFGIAVNFQWGRYRQESLSVGNRLVFAFSIFVCLLTTTHWWLNVWWIYDGFLQTPTPMAREMFFNDFGSTIAIIKLTTYEIQTWTGDLLLIYRLYYIAGRRWDIVVPPTLMCCASAVCGAKYLYYICKIDSTPPADLPPYRGWLMAAYSVTVVENIYCLGLIAFFIWRTHSNVSQVTSSSLQSILRVFIESAGMWVFFVILTGIVYLFSLEGYMLVLYMTNPILGISSCMITIRLQLRKKSTPTASGNTKPPYLSDFRAATREQNLYTVGSENAPNELVVFSPRLTVHDSESDATTSEVYNKP